MATQKKATAALLVNADSALATIDVTLEKVTPRTHKEIGRIRVFLYNDGRESHATLDLFYPSDDTEHLRGYRSARPEEREMALEAAKSWSNTEWGKAALAAYNYKTKQETAFAQPIPYDPEELTEETKEALAASREAYLSSPEYKAEQEREAATAKILADFIDGGASLYWQDTERDINGNSDIQAAWHEYLDSLSQDEDGNDDLNSPYAQARWYLTEAELERVREALQSEALADSLEEYLTSAEEQDHYRGDDEEARQATEAIAAEYGAAGIEYFREALAKAYKLGREQAQ